ARRVDRDPAIIRLGRGVAALDATESRAHHPRLRLVLHALFALGSGDREIDRAARAVRVAGLLVGLRGAGEIARSVRLREIRRGLGVRPGRELRLRAVARDVRGDQWQSLLEALEERHGPRALAGADRGAGADIAHLGASPLGLGERVDAGRGVRPALEAHGVD